MGFADLVQAEETVSIKISEYRELIENNTELDMLRQVSNGTAPEVYVRILRKGCETAFSEADREELKAYRETGITPDRFQVIDEEYRKLSEDNARLTEEKAKLFDQVKALEQKCRGLEESSRNYYLGCGKKQGRIDAMGTQIAELRGAVQEKTAQIDELESTIQERNTQIENLKNRLAERDLHIDGLLSMMQGSEAEDDGE